MTRRGYDPKKEYTIETDDWGDVVVYEWGVFPRNSVLAGQESKQYHKDFPTLEEALKEYPTAVQEVRYPYNYTDHLPDYDMTAYEDENYGVREDY